MSRALVVIPAYDEAETIEEVVTRSLAHADVCVVDDGSRDATREIVRGLMAGASGLHLIEHEVNTHIAGALLDGMRFASEHAYPRCITMDAGLSHDPDALPLFLAREEADLVVGARAERVDAPLYRHALSWAGKSLINLGLERRFVPWGGASISDTTSGYRLYARRAYELLLAAPMKSRSFDFHLEALAYVYRAGLRVEEVPITYVFSNSSLRPRIVLEALQTCGRLWSEDFSV